MKQKLWTSDMTDKEKILAFAGYSITQRIYDNGNYKHDCILTHQVNSPYQYACEKCPADCIDASVMIVDIADDLGLEGKYINYANSISDDPFNFSVGADHVMAYIHFADGWHTIEATPDTEY